MKEISSSLSRHLPFLRQIFGEGTESESARKRKHSDVVSEERATSSVSTGRHRELQRNELGDASHAAARDASTSEEDLSLRAFFLNTTANRRSPLESTAASELTGTVPDARATIVQPANNSGEHLPRRNLSIQTTGNWSSSFGSIVSSELTGTVPDARDTIPQPANSSGDNLSLRNLFFQTTGNHGRFPSAVGSESASVLTETDTDSGATITQPANTSGEHLSLRNLFFQTNGNLGSSFGSTDASELTGTVSDAGTTFSQPVNSIGENLSLTAASELTGTVPDALPTNNSGEHLPPRNLVFQTAGDYSQIPSASIGSAVATVHTETDPNARSTLVQHANTIGDGQPARLNRNDFQCPICLVSVGVGQIKRMFCLHKFHQACIDAWLNRSKSCPVCRQPYRKLRRRRHRR